MPRDKIVDGVTGPMDLYPGVDMGTHECDVADDVENLVANELVRKAQSTFVHDSSVAYDHGVVKASALDESHLA